MKPSIIREIMACLHLERPVTLPILLFSSPFDLRVLGMSHAEYTGSAEAMVGAHTRAVERFGYHWIFLHVDSCVALEPIGIESGPADPESVLPWTPHKHLSASQKTLESLAVPDPQADGRMPMVLEVITRLRERFGDQVCICGHVTAPFSSVYYLFGTEPALMLLKDDQGVFKDAIGFMLDLQSRFAIAQIRAGADAIEIGDLGSSSHFISLETYQEYSLPPLRHLAKAITAEGGWSLYHQNEPRIDYIVASVEAFSRGTGALNIGQGADIHETARILEGRICLTGGIDPLAINRPISYEELEQIIVPLVESLGRQGGFMMNSAGQIAIETPEENIRRIFEIVDRCW